MSQLTGLAYLLGIGAAVYALLLVAGLRWKLQHPPRRTYASALAKNLPSDPSELDTPLNYESWILRSRGLAMPVWDIQARNPGGPTVILTPGWGDSRIGALVRVPHLAPHASRIITWDTAGHGEATGHSTLGVKEVQDLCALMEQIEGPVVLFGWSLGAGVSIAAAASVGQSDSTHPNKVVAVIAEAPYRFPETPARNVLRMSNLPSGLSLTATMWTLGLAGGGRRRFDRCAHAARTNCPLLVIHGQDDRVCPVEDGRLIADAAPQGRFVAIAGGDHNHLWTDPDMLAQTRDAISAFLAAVGSYHCEHVHAAPEPDG